MTNYNLLLEKPLEYNLSVSFFDDIKYFKFILTKFNTNYFLNQLSDAEGDISVADNFTGNNIGHFIFIALADLYFYEGLLEKSNLELVNFLPSVAKINDELDNSVKVSKVFKSLFETVGNSVNSTEFNSIRLILSAAIASSFFITIGELNYLFNLLKFLHIDFINSFSEFGAFFTNSGKFLPFNLLSLDNYGSENFFLSLLDKKNKFAVSGFSESNKTFVYIAFCLFQSSDYSTSSFSLLLKLTSLP